MDTKNLLTISQAAKYLKISKDTLRRWEKKNIIKPFRSPTGWRYYDKKQLDYVFIQKPDFNKPKTDLTSNKSKTATIHPKKTTKGKEKYLLYPFVIFIVINIILLIIYFVTFKNTF